MYKYYKGSLLRMHGKLHELRVDPSQSQLCLCVQEELVDRIRYIENRIRQHRMVLGSLRKQLHHKSSELLNKTTARSMRDSISTLNEQIDQYQSLLAIFRSIGDGLAFTYIDKYDIKPLAFKQPPGFISGKKGLGKELRFLRLVFAKGDVGILTDLTSCLRYGDVCVAVEKSPLVFEIKTGHAFNARTKRQRNDLNHISSYLHHDKTDALYGVEGDFRREALHSPERNHIDELNSIIAAASRSKSKCCLEEVEDGLYYGADFGADIHMLDPILARHPGKLVISMANEWKYSTVGYYPFSLSIRDPKMWYDFCRGELIITVAVDYRLIQQKLSLEGLSLEQDPVPGWFSDAHFDITSVRPNAKFKKLQVGGHFFGRLFSEFLSLDWMIESIVDRARRFDSWRS